MGFDGVLECLPPDAHQGANGYCPPFVPWDLPFCCCISAEGMVKGVRAHARSVFPSTD